MRVFGWEGEKRGRAEAYPGGANRGVHKRGEKEISLVIRQRGGERMEQKKAEEGFVPKGELKKRQGVTSWRKKNEAMGRMDRHVSWGKSRETSLKETNRRKVLEKPAYQAS